MYYTQVARPGKMVIAREGVTGGRMATTSVREESWRPSVGNGFPNPHHERLLRELLNADQPLTLSELARRVDLHPTRAGRYCDRLLIAKYVSRKPRDIRRVENGVATTIQIQLWTLAREGILYLASRGVARTPRAALLSIERWDDTQWSSITQVEPNSPPARIADWTNGTRDVYVFECKPTWGKVYRCTDNTAPTTDAQGLRCWRGPKVVTVKPGRTHELSLRLGRDSSPVRIRVRHEILEVPVKR